ncbi:MAG: hypothetical protein M5U28_39550 [Sandaracinaceae bacterium]|nr:hypothetical protein [Sandaracinaceae bacterium]
MKRPVTGSCSRTSAPSAMESTTLCSSRPAALRRATCTASSCSQGALVACSARRRARRPVAWSRRHTTPSIVVKNTLSPSRTGAFITSALMARVQSTRPVSRSIAVKP